METLGIKKALGTIGDYTKSREEVPRGSGQWKEHTKDNCNLLYNLASDRIDLSLFRVKKRSYLTHFLSAGSRGYGLKK